MDTTSAAMEAIRELFSDTSRTKEETLSALEEVLDEVASMIDSLK